MRLHVGWFLSLIILVDVVSIASGSRKSSATVPSVANNRRRGKAKKRQRPVTTDAIVPTRKEPLTFRALRGMQILKKNLLNNAEAALATTGKVQRKLKTYFSSDYEQLLLRMTAPTSDKPEGDDVERFVATIETFVRNMDLHSQSNPYRVTLRKLWTKAAEPDGRTVLKATILLHTVLRKTTPEDALIFKTLMNKMMRETCRKPGKCKYFDMNKITAVSATTIDLQDFIERYATFVFQRAKTFTSSFEEMKLIEYGMRTEDICAQLMKAYKVLDTALSCNQFVELAESSDVVLACMELVASDVRDLFGLFHTKLLWVLREEQKGDIFAGWETAEVKAVLTHFKTFYNDRYEDIECFLNTCGKLVKRRLRNTAFDAALPPPAVFEDHNIPAYPRRRHRRSHRKGSSFASSSSSLIGGQARGSGSGSGSSSRSSHSSSSSSSSSSSNSCISSSSSSSAGSGSGSGSGSAAIDDSMATSTTSDFDLDESARRTDEALALLSGHSDLGAVTEPDMTPSTSTSISISVSASGSTSTSTSASTSTSTST